MRDYFVFVRAGRSSLHRELLDADPDRNWDCCINAWAGIADADAPDVSCGRIEAFRDKLRSQGIEPEDELAEVQARYPAWGAMATRASGHVYRCPLAPVGQRYRAPHDAALGMG